MVKEKKINNILITGAYRFIDRKLKLKFKFKYKI